VSPSSLFFSRISCLFFFILSSYRVIKKRPLNRHTPRSLILAIDYAQKFSPQINVELMVGLEVFRQHADRIASQPPLTAHWRLRLWLTQHTDDLGKSRAWTMRKAWDVHRNHLWLRREFLLTFSESWGNTLSRSVLMYPDCQWDVQVVFQGKVQLRYM